MKILVIKMVEDYFLKIFLHDFLISSLFKDLIVGDAVIQNPFEWKVVSVIYLSV